jgi:hypothetical protein
MKADGRDVVEGFFASFAVEGFNVAEGVIEAIAGHAHLVGGESVEHEGVIGVGTMGNRDIGHCGGGNSGCFGAHGR